MKKIFFKNDQTKIILFNLGKLISYIAGILLLYHGIENVISHTKITFSILGFLISTIFSQILTLPHKWDKFWIRIGTLISLTINFLTLCTYIYTLSF